jgi:hypothetical protein
VRWGERGSVSRGAGEGLVQFQLSTEKRKGIRAVQCALSSGRSSWKEVLVGQKPMCRSPLVGELYGCVLMTALRMQGTTNLL